MLAFTILKRIDLSARERRKKFLMRAAREEKRKESADSQAKHRKSQVFARILLLFEQLGSCFKAAFPQREAAFGSMIYVARAAQLLPRRRVYISKAEVLFGSCVDN